MGNVFTLKDALRLNEITKERDLLIGRRDTALAHVVEALRSVPGMDSGKWDVENVVFCAEAIRDALQPFDSGIRPEPEVPDA